MSDHDWHTEDFPELRAGPPWVMQEMIAAQPAVVEALLSSPPPDATLAAAEAIAAALEDDRPVTVCGCGTSEHAAHAIAALLSAAVHSGSPALVRARPAMSAALDPAPGVCLAVSHDGGTRATNLALHAARAAGAHTIAITNQPGGAVARAAEHCSSRPATTTRGATRGLHVRAGRRRRARRPPRRSRRGAGRGARAPRARDEAPGRRGGRRPPGRQPRRPLRRSPGRPHHRPRAGPEDRRGRPPAHDRARARDGPARQLAGHEPADALILVAITDHPERERIARRAALVARAAAAIGLPVAGLLSTPTTGCSPRS